MKPGLFESGLARIAGWIASWVAVGLIAVGAIFILMWLTNQEPAPAIIVCEPDAPPAQETVQWFTGSLVSTSLFLSLETTSKLPKGK